MTIINRKVSFATIRIIIALTILLVAFVWANAQVISNKSTRFDELQIRAEHPRIWIDAKKSTWLKAKCKGKSVVEIQQLAGTSIAGAALTYLITSDEKTGLLAIGRALNKYVDPGSGFKDLNSPDGENKRVHIQASLTDMALCYNWCYPLLSAHEKTEFRQLMVADMKKYIGVTNTGDYGKIINHLL